MSITKLIADMDMDLDIVDLSEDESAEKTVIKLKDGTAFMNSGQNETETNNEQIETNVQNDNAAEVNWDLLEMEIDLEEVNSEKESQGSDNSVLLLEAGSGSLLLSSREENLDKNENNSLGLDMGEQEYDYLNGSSQTYVVSSSQSKVGSANDNLELGLNVSEKPDLALGVEENSAITDDEDKEVAEKKVAFVLVSADNMEIENENMKTLDKNDDLDVDKNQSSGQDLLSESKASEIDNMEGSNLNSDSDACANNILCLGTGEADDNLKGSSGCSVVGSIERNDTCRENAEADFVLREVVNSEILIKDGEMGFAENKDKIEEVDPGKLNLEGIIANSNAGRNDSELNSFESAPDTSVQDMAAGVSMTPEANRDQTENLKHLVDNANRHFSLNSGTSNDTDQVTGNNELETVGLGSALERSQGSKSPKKRGRPPKGQGKTNLVIHNTGESSSSREPRKTKRSWYLKGPYVMHGESHHIFPKEKITEGEHKEVNKIEGKKVKTTRDSSAGVSKGNDGKTEKNPEEVIQDLISAARGLLNPENSILRKPGRRFLTSFRNSVSTSEVAIGLPPVLLDAKDKLENMIMSLHGSGLEGKESLIGDARGLLEKVNLMLTTNCTGGKTS
jgi:hypothetical protein